MEEMRNMRGYFGHIGANSSVSSQGISKHAINIKGYACKEEKSLAPDKGTGVKAAPNLYTLAVYLTGGPIGDEFESQTISRTILDSLSFIQLA
jgi:hypothetical protein